MKLKKKNAKIKNNEILDWCWDELQHLFRNIQALYHPTIDGKYVIKGDASSVAGASVLYQLQKIQGKFKYVIIDLFSKQFPSHMIAWHIGNKEAQIIVWSLQQWTYKIKFRPIIVASDHNNLDGIFNPNNENYFNPIYVRQRILLSPFHITLKIVKGLEVPLADAMSRGYVVPMEIKSYTHNEKQIKFLSDNEIIKLKERINYQNNKIEKERRELNENILNNYSIKFISLVPNQQLFYFTFNRFSKFYNNNIMYCNIKKDSNIKYFELIRDTEKILNSQICLLLNEMKKDYNCNILYNQMKEVINYDINNGTFHGPKLINIETEPVYQLNEMLLNNDELLNFISKNNIYYINTIKNSILLDKNEINKLIDDINIIEMKLNKIENNNRYLISAVQTRAEIKKIEKEKREKLLKLQNKTEEEMVIEEELNELKKENYDSIALRKYLFNALYPDDTLDIGNIKAWRYSQSIDDGCKMVVEYLTNKENLIKQERFEKFKESRNKLYKLLLADKCRINNKTKLVEVLQLVLPMKNIYEYVLLLPLNLVGQALRFIHERLSNIHTGRDGSIKYAKKKYWWDNMENDITTHVKTCRLCQLGKGAIRKVGKLAPSYPTKPRDWIISDFAGPFHGNLYVHIAVCRFSGYLRLVATYGSGAEEAADAIIQDWIPNMGWFRKFSTDKGSCYDNQLQQCVTDTFGMEHHFSSAHCHKSTGLAEGNVKIVKNILQKWNIQLKDELVDDNDRYAAQEKIKLILPMIQFGVNQRILSFTNVSPHMLIFGEQLTELVDINLSINKLNTLKRDIKNESFKDYINKLNLQLNILREILKEDSDKHIKIMKKSYDKNIKEDEDFKIGDEIVYYVGDSDKPLRKLRARFTGPWVVSGIVRDNTIEIKDPSNGNKFTSHISRVKKYYKKGFYSLSEYNKLSKERLNEENKID